MTLISNKDINIKMTRLSRDQQFTSSFTDFMVCLQDEYLHLKKWSIHCTTKNKSSSVHEYALQIPKQTVLYTIDAHTNALTGERVESEVVMEDQDVPDNRTLHLFFGDYFVDFDLEKSGKVLSGTYITDIKIDIVPAYGFASCDSILEWQTVS